MYLRDAGAAAAAAGDDVVPRVVVEVVADAFVADVGVSRRGSLRYVLLGV